MTTAPDALAPTAAEGRRCCSAAFGRGLVLPDGRQRCWHHAELADVQLVESLDARAGALGLRRSQADVRQWGRRHTWPYGPNIDVGARQRLADWAEYLGLRLAHTRGGGCPHWPRNGRRCSGWARCFGGGWVDHTTTWTRAGTPALFLSQPYHLGEPDMAELQALDLDPGLAVTVRGLAPWYGHEALSVEVWRAGEWQGELP